MTSPGTTNTANGNPTDLRIPASSEVGWARGPHMVRIHTMAMGIQPSMKRMNDEEVLSFRKAISSWLFEGLAA